MSRFVSGLVLVALAAQGCGRQPLSAVAHDAGALDAGAPDAAPPDLATDDGDVTMAHGDHYQFVVKQVLLPTRTADYAVDLDGDAHPDNQLGAFLPPIVEEGWQLQSSYDNNVAMGDVVVLLDLQTADPLLLDDDQVGLTVSRGVPMASPDFTGHGQFTVDHDVTATTVYGKLQGGSFHSNDPVTTTHPAALTLFLPVLTVNNLLPVTLHGAHAQFTRTSGLLIGELHGSVRMSDITTVIIPSIAAGFTIELSIEPPGTGVYGNWIESHFDVGGCTNPDGTIAAAADLKIGACEVSQQPLITPLRTADVRIYDDQGNYAPRASEPRKDSWSYGIGFIAVPASF